MQNSELYCLLIDPQNQATKFLIKHFSKRNEKNFVITKPGKKFENDLVMAVRLG